MDFLSIVHSAAELIESMKFVDRKQRNFQHFREIEGSVPCS
jgi:hypothetical protein